MCLLNVFPYSACPELSPGSVSSLGTGDTSSTAGLPSFLCHGVSEFKASHSLVRGPLAYPTRRYELVLGLLLLRPDDHVLNSCGVHPSVSRLKFGPYDSLLAIFDRLRSIALVSFLRHNSLLRRAYAPRVPTGFPPRAQLADWHFF